MPFVFDEIEIKAYSKQADGTSAKKMFEWVESAKYFYESALQHRAGVHCSLIAGNVYENGDREVNLVLVPLIHLENDYVRGNHFGEIVHDHSCEYLLDDGLLSLQMQKVIAFRVRLTLKIGVRVRGVRCEL